MKIKLSWLHLISTITALLGQVVILFCLLSSSVHAQANTLTSENTQPPKNMPKEINLSDKGARNFLTSSMQYLSTSDRSLTINDITSSQYLSAFKPLGSQTIGFSRDVYWARLVINNDSQQSLWYLRNDYPLTYNLSLYMRDQDGHFVEESLSWEDDLSMRNIPDRLMTYRLSIPIGETRDVFLRQETATSVNFSLRLLSDHELLASHSTKAYLQAFFYSVLVLLALINIQLAILKQAYSYVYVSIFCFSFILANAIFEGDFQSLINLFDRHVSLIMIGGSIAIALLSISFFQRYLFPPLKQNKWATNAYYALGAAWIMFIGISVVSPAKFWLGLLLTGMIHSIYCFLISLTAYLKGYDHSRYLLVGISMFTLGVCLQGLYRFGFFDSFPMAAEGGRIGIIALALMMTLSLQNFIRELQNKATYSRQKFKAIFENISDAIYILNDAGKITDLNTEALNLEGGSLDSLLEQSFLSKSVLASTQYNKELLKNACEGIKAGESRQLELGFDSEQLKRYLNVSIKPYIEADDHSTLIAVRDVSEIKRQESRINTIVSALSKQTGGAFFEELALRMADITAYEYILIGACDNADLEQGACHLPQRISTLAYCVKSQIVENITYELQGTPCQAVLNDDVCIYDDKVSELFPSDVFLCEYNIRSYVGKTLYDSEERPIGMIALLDTRPLVDRSVIDIVNIFSSRAAVEVERLNNLQRLIQTQQKLALHVENTPLGVVHFDNENKVIDWNHSAERIFGVTRKAILGKPSIETIFASLSEQQVGQLLLNNSHSNRNIFCHRLSNAKEIFCEWFVTPLMAEGKELGYAALVSDVTYERESFVTLARKEREQSEILNSMDDGVITINEKGSVISFNHAAEKLFGYKAEEIKDQNVRILMQKEHADYHDSYLADYLKTGKSSIIGVGRELEGLHKNGRLFPMRLQVAELPQSKRGGRRFIGTCHDLTLLREQELQIRHSQKMDALGKLTGGVAHDFNNLLGIISGYTGLLSALVVGEETEERYLREIERASERGAKLTKKLLYLSKRRTLETKVVNLNKVLHGMQHVLERTLTPRILLRIRLDESISSVKLDPDFLEDTMLNLSINAMHAMNGEGELSISTQSNVKVDRTQAKINEVEPGDYITLTVRDNGCGMSAKIQERVFDPFYSTKGERGTGLGLSQVYSFIKQSEGFIKLNSETGKGAEFVMYFPQSDLTESALDSKENSQASLAELKGNETILIVDDETALLFAAAEILKQAGYQVISCGSSEEALNLLGNNAFALLLSDVVMPNMGGFELADKAKEINPGMKIQLMSGFAARPNDQQAHPLSHTILSKPYTPEGLLRKVRGILDDNLDE